MRCFEVKFVCDRGMPKESVRSMANNYADSQGWKDAWYWSHTASTAVMPIIDSNIKASVVTVLFRTPSEIPLSIETTERLEPLGLSMEYSRPGHCEYDDDDVVLPAFLLSSSPHRLHVLQGVEQLSDEQIRLMCSSKDERRNSRLSVLASVSIHSLDVRARLWGIHEQKGTFKAIESTKAVLLLGLRLPRIRDELPGRVLRCVHIEPNERDDEDDAPTFHVIEGDKKIGLVWFCKDGFLLVFRELCTEFEVVVQGVTDGVTSAPDFPSWLKAKESAYEPAKEDGHAGV